MKSRDKKQRSPNIQLLLISDYFQDACVEKIARFIGGDGLGMVDRHYGYGRQNTYQRTLSQDSTANSTRSDETFTVNGKEQ